MFKGVVWVEFKLLVGVILIISLGPGSSAGKVGAYAVERRSEIGSCVTKATPGSMRC